MPPGRPAHPKPGADAEEGRRAPLSVIAASRGFAPALAGEPPQRLENWNERRAFARPYFLRSTTRGSRVRNPPRLSTLRKSGSYWVSALEMAWRTAPAWPERPPPDTVQVISYCPCRLEATSGCWI